MAVGMSDQHLDPKEEPVMKIVPVSEKELNRSAQLYRRLGELSAEVSQLPTE
jgi:hypothetical protein